MATALAALDEARNAHVDHAVQRDHPRGLKAFTDRTTTNMLGGKPRPTGSDLTAQILSAINEDKAYEATTEHLTRLRDQLDLALGQVLVDAEGAMLEGIATRVRDTLARARQAREALTGVDLTQPEAVATASAGQRRAIAALPDIARDYNRGRLLQRLVYLATGLPRPGYTTSDPTPSWSPVFTRGVHEFQGVTLGDTGPSTDLPARVRILAVAARTDVWVPTRLDMAGVLDALHLPASSAIIAAPNRHSDAGRPNRSMVSRGATPLERAAGR